MQETGVEELTFEAAFSELEELVRKLEGGGLTLEESLALYERGQTLAACCNAQLDAAELKIRQLVPDGKGGMTPVPFTPELG